ncbi:hypothetical protein VKT23_014166 [Stygiomarasmius scandens]|uniref:Uncharacterized protein n=1 Tax=Marasmiellus scandens TaxID=2682957 RepID=A0ABR1J1G7_9AGAR
MSIASAVFGSLNYFFSDAVVVWRAWVLVNRQCRIVLSILMIGSTAALASMIASDLPIPNSVFGSMAVTTTAILLPFLLTNVVATMMIGYKFWHHRQALRNSSQLPDNLIAEQISEPQNEVQKILLIIVESGFLYLILWTFALIAESGALGPYAMFIEKTFLPHLAAIYPLLVFLLVACQKSEISMLAQRSKARA